MIHFLCPFCRKSLKARPADAGKKCRCSGCDLMVDIPGTKIPEPASEETVKPEEEPFALPVERNDRAALNYYTPQFDIVPVIRFFLKLTFWLSILVTILSVAFFVMMDARPAERGFLIGYVLGAWFGFMVVIATAWLLTEVVLELRFLRSNRH